MSEQTKPERKDIGALWEKTSQNGMTGIRRRVRM